MIHLAIQHGPDLVRCPISAWSAERNVFVITPFDGVRAQMLKPDLVMTFGPGRPPSTNVLEDDHFQGATDELPTTGPRPMDQDAYEALVEKALSAIRSKDLEKVVLSRTTLLELDGASPADLFLKACELHPDAFLCLFHGPGHGVWLGASPERLMRAEDGRLEVDAIAGTKPMDLAPEAPSDWGPKERHEQELVTRAVLDAFLDVGVNGVTVRG
ncbi:MAG: chorismate-binding protein, partial [Flavobacteriales bacterium]|nr:chorismate-binding protein [Flavobacteriales bacterium]